MTHEFAKYADKGHEFVKLVSEELKIPTDNSVRIIRSVLHALRNKLTHEESFHLIAQLPMVLKGIYVDGWKFTKKQERLNHLSEFLDEVRTEDGGLAGYDFGNNKKAVSAVSAVFKALSYFVSEGEMNDIKSILPAEIKQFIQESLSGKETVL